MKAKFTPLILLLCTFFIAHAQQPALQNGSFENWTSTTPSYPVGWDTDDHLISELSTAIPQRGWTTKDTTSANVVAGTASCRLRTDTVFLGAQMEVAPGIVAFGILALDANENPYPIALAFNGRPTVFSGSLKYQPNGNDTGQYQVYLSKWDATGDSEIVVVNLNNRILNTDSGFITFSDTLQYLSSVTPDSIIIAFSSGLLNGNPVTGSILWVDNLAFEYLSTGIQHLDIDDAIKIFPNPASNTLTLTVDNYLAGNLFKVYDLSGKLVKAFTIESSAYSLNISNLADGQYIYAVENKAGKILKQSKFSIIK